MLSKAKMMWRHLRIYIMFFNQVTIIALVVCILEQWFSTLEAWRLSSDEFVWILSNFDHSNSEYQIRLWLNSTYQTKFDWIRPQISRIRQNLTFFRPTYYKYNKFNELVSSNWLHFLVKKEYFWYQKSYLNGNGGWFCQN